MQGIGEVHHEIELGLVISKKCSKLQTPETYKDYIGGYFMALDMTARDLQTEAKQKGLPWYAIAIL